jgi:polyhydroxyalkanoate synthase
VSSDVSRTDRESEEYRPLLDLRRLPAGAGALVRRHSLHYTGQLASIVTGGSPIQPAPGDKRFTDPTFVDNPVYRRVMQAYLALCDEVDTAVGDADLRWKDKELVRFLATMVTSTLAPTNVPIGNPAAIKRAFETGGASLALGARNLIHDLRFNGGMPSQVKQDALRVGEDLAATPGAVVYRDAVCELIQYAPATSQRYRRKPRL